MAPRQLLIIVSEAAVVRRRCRTLRTDDLAGVVADDDLPCFTLHWMLRASPIVSAARYRHRCCRVLVLDGAKTFNNVMATQYLVGYVRGAIGEALLDSMSAA
jgi:hypothetical protein